MEFYGSVGGRLLALLGPRIADPSGTLEAKTRELVSMAELRAMPHATLGYAMSEWLHEHGFPTLTDDAYILGLEPWRLARAVKWHDAIHVVLGTGAYGPSDEMLTMGAALASRRVPPPYFTAIAALLPVLAMGSRTYRRAVPMLWKGAVSMRRAGFTGPTADWVGFDWEGHLDTALLDVRQMFGVPKWGVDPSRVEVEKHKAMRSRLDDD